MPPVRIELTTFALQVQRSTTKLRRQTLEVSRKSDVLLSNNIYATIVSPFFFSLLLAEGTRRS